ncbi:hypothetical protein HII12_002909 [Brettanomyces bruxellensis]|uniref:E3 ubiquitin-protein ligase n=1 Tax=Dekkera bruxellensis TaxID=5007 RepID=A0A8H6BE61_DEKBR|nr:hypothetical protein HII12_002909 [Brettanomyces bruxellensis]
MSEAEPSPSPPSSALDEESSLSSKSLPELLTMIPEKLEFEVHNTDPKRVSTLTLRLLYFFAAGNGQYYQDIFPGRMTQPMMIFLCLLMIYGLLMIALMIQLMNTMMHREAIPIKAREHSDHNVSRHISQGNAICDCGDVSSWKRPLDCLANKMDKRSNYGELPQGLKKNLTSAIESALDFFLDVQSLNVQVLRSTLDDRTDQEIVAADEDIDELTFLDGSKYGVETDCLCNWYLIAWNDEFHDWNTAVKTISLARNQFDEDSGQMSVNLASIIDSKGYTSIWQATKVEDLIGPFSQFRNTGMTATVLSAKTAIRLEVADAAVEFIFKIVHCTNSKISEFSMKVLSDLLLKTYPSFFYVDESKISVDDKNSLLCSDGIPLIDRGNVDIPPLSGVSNLLLQNSRSLPSTSPTRIGVKRDFTRLQLLFFLERRFPKCTRKILRTLIVPVITSTPESRTEFGMQIAEILPTLENINQYYDREWHLSLLESFRLQIYHDPCIGTALLEKGTFKNILQSALGCFLRYGKRSHGYLVYVRKTGDHVEHEDLKYKRYFTLAVVAYDIARYIGKLVSTIKGRNEVIENAIKFTSAYLNARYKIPTGDNAAKVSSDPVSLLHPLQSLLAQLCMNYSCFNTSLLLPANCSLQSASGLDKSLYALSYGSCSSLVESDVLSAQIKTGFG